MVRQNEDELVSSHLYDSIHHNVYSLQYVLQLVMDLYLNTI